MCIDTCVWIRKDTELRSRILLLNAACAKLFAFSKILGEGISLHFHFFENIQVRIYESKYMIESILITYTEHLFPLPRGNRLFQRKEARFYESKHSFKKFSYPWFVPNWIYRNNFETMWTFTYLAMFLSKDRVGILSPTHWNVSFVITLLTDHEMEAACNWFDRLHVSAVRIRTKMTIKKTGSDFSLLISQWCSPSFV